MTASKSSGLIGAIAKVTLYKRTLYKRTFYKLTLSKATFSITLFLKSLSKFELRYQFSNPFKTLKVHWLQREVLKPK